MSPYIIAVWLPILLALIAIACLVRELRRRTLTETAFCGKCGYNLTGLQSDNCPECGRNLHWGGAVHGQWSPRRSRIAIGVLLLVFAGGLFSLWSSYRFRSFSLDAFLPNSVLVEHFATGGAGARQRAYALLHGRILNGQVSVEDQHRLADSALARLAAESATAASAPANSSGPPTFDRLSIMMLEELAHAGRLKLEQVERSGKLAYDGFMLELAPRVRVGRPVPFRVGYRLSPLAMQMTYSAVELPLGKVLVDGVPQDDDARVLAPWEWQAGEQKSGVLVFDRPGTRTVRIKLEPRNPNSSVLGRWQPDVSATLEVDPDEEASAAETTPDE